MTCCGSEHWLGDYWNDKANRKPGYLRGERHTLTRCVSHTLSFVRLFLHVTFVGVSWESWVMNFSKWNGAAKISSIFMYPCIWWVKASVWSLFFHTKNRIVITRCNFLEIFIKVFITNTIINLLLPRFYPGGRGCFQDASAILHNARGMVYRGWQWCMCPSSQLPGMGRTKKGLKKTIL